MKRILALVDHSVYATSVADHAAWLADTFAATIDLVHIVSPYDKASINAGMAGLAVGGPGLVGQIAYHSERRLEDLVVEGQRLVDGLTTRLASSKAGICLGRVVVGEIADVLSDAGLDSDIIVAGKRGADADFVSLTLGTVLEKIIHASKRPLLMAPRIFRPISGWVLAYGTGTEITSGLEHVVKDQLLPKLPCEIVYVGSPDEGLKTEIQAARNLLSAAGHPVSIDIVDGRPVHALAARMVSEDTRLIAVGGFSRLRLLPAIFGEGTSTEIIKASLAPVLLLR